MWESFMRFMEQQLQNDFFSGGAFLVFVTAVLASLRKVPEHLYSFAKRRLVTTVDISDKDPLFFWVQLWLSKKVDVTKHRLLTATTQADQYTRARVLFGDDSKKVPSIIFSYAPGNHLLKYNNQLILLTRDRTEPDKMSGDTPFHESFVLRSLSKKAIISLLEEARELAHPDKNQISIFRHTYSDWFSTQSCTPRPFESLVLEDKALEELSADLEWFLTSKEWYEERGIPYRRGYLFYGPPGNGKTSTIMALAGHFQRNVYTLSLSSLTDNNLSMLMITLPEHSFLVIEDVDSFAENREVKSAEDALTFSGILNAIDGLGVANGRVLFLTTNHKEKLDPALIRPGRADKQVLFTNANAGKAKQLFERFYPEYANTSVAAKFADIISTSNTAYSMADLQELLIYHREEPEKVLERFSNLK